MYERKQVTFFTYRVNSCRNGCHRSFGLVFLLGSFHNQDWFVWCISFDQVPDSLSNQVGVSLNNYLWVSLYIILINGPLEEFFFRYFVMKNTWFKSHFVLVSVSSFLFAIYHVGMLFTMFDFYVFIIAILGLMIVGMFFIWLNHQNKGILYSVLIHMFANAGINLVGYIILSGAS